MQQLRCIKVMVKLICLAVKFYLLAWFYVPRSFLMDAQAPKTLNELEYEAKNNPAFLCVLAFYAIFFSCSVSYALYVIPLQILAEYF